MRRFSSFVISVLLLCTHAVLIWAQAAKSELVGEVRDQNGALVIEAKLTLTEVSTHQAVVVRTAQGSYTITNLRPGLYNIAVEANGFKQSVREEVKLATGERIRLDFVLQPGAPTETVTVVDDASLLRTESGSLGQIIPNRKIVDL